MRDKEGNDKAFSFAAYENEIAYYNPSNIFFPYPETGDEMLDIPTKVQNNTNLSMWPPFESFYSIQNFNNILLIINLDLIFLLSYPSHWLPANSI